MTAPAGIPQEFGLERAAATAELNRCLGTLRYLHTLADERAAAAAADAAAPSAAAVATVRSQLPPAAAAGAAAIARAAAAAAAGGAAAEGGSPASTAAAATVVAPGEPSPSAGKCEGTMVPGSRPPWSRGLDGVGCSTGQPDHQPPSVGPHTGSTPGKGCVRGKGFVRGKGCVRGAGRPPCSLRLAGCSGSALQEPWCGDRVRSSESAGRQLSVWRGTWTWLPAVEQAPVARSIARPRLRPARPSTSRTRFDAWRLEISALSSEPGAGRR
jgi:hypothetical protein